MTGSPARGVTAVVLCGGQSRRLGRDKTRQRFGSGTVLDRVLSEVPAHWAVVAVGPERPTARTVAWTREEPPGGGPLAAVAAGLRRVETPVAVLVAGDMPFAGPALVLLVQALAADPAVDAAAAAVLPGDSPSAGPDSPSAGLDSRYVQSARLEGPTTARNVSSAGVGAGATARNVSSAGVGAGARAGRAVRANPLLAAYRTAPARAALPAQPAGRPARALLDAVPHSLVAVPEDSLLDIDTAADLAAARARLAPSG